MDNRVCHCIQYENPQVEEKVTAGIKIILFILATLKTMVHKESSLYSTSLVKNMSETRCP